MESLVYRVYHLKLNGIRCDRDHDPYRVCYQCYGTGYLGGYELGGSYRASRWTIEHSSFEPFGVDEVWSVATIETHSHNFPEDVRTGDIVVDSTLSRWRVLNSLHEDIGDAEDTLPTEGVLVDGRSIFVRKLQIYESANYFQG